MDANHLLLLPVQFPNFLVPPLQVIPLHLLHYKFHHLLLPHHHHPKTIYSLLLHILSTFISVFATTHHNLPSYHYHLHLQGNLGSRPPPGSVNSWVCEVIMLLGISIFTVGCCQASHWCMSSTNLRALLPLCLGKMNQIFCWTCGKFIHNPRQTSSRMISVMICLADLVWSSMVLSP